MRLRELKIKNFRKLDDVTVAFPKGLCVVVGENNTGKTAIIDALRLMLIPARDLDALRITEDDFKSGSNGAPIEISCTFCDTTDAEEAHFQECLVDTGDGKFEIRLNARVEFNETTCRANVKMWGGETEGVGRCPRPYTIGLRRSIYSPSVTHNLASVRGVIRRFLGWSTV